MTQQVSSQVSLSNPPDEQFWQRYSPRSEFPLSSVASISLHLLVLALLLVGGVLLIRSQDAYQPLSASAIEISDSPGNGGTGGSGANQPSEKREDIEPSPAPLLPNLPAGPEKLEVPARKPQEPLPQINDPSDPVIKEAKDAERELEIAADKIRDRILGQQNPSAGPIGPIGPIGPKGGVPIGQMASKRTRMDRWVLTFETQDGNDYARQLDALGAIVAIPQPDGQYLIIRDLKERPARGRLEDIATIQRIFWVDNKPQSVRSLAAALRLPQVPPWVAAFFPEDLERDLLRKELAFRNRREEDIRRTYFRLERKGTGYEPVVVRQEPRPGVR